MGGSNYLWRTVGRVCVAVHTASEPTDEEWDGYLAGMKRFPRVREVRVLILSHGGGPSGVQRQKLQRQAGTHSPPVAILTASGVRMRGISTVLKWFNEHVAVFEESQLNAACDHLGLSKMESAGARACMAELDQELTGRRPRTAVR
jgi:hypothetical protein